MPALSLSAQQFDLLSPIAYVAMRLLLTGYFVLAGVWDTAIQRGRVPNWLTLPPLVLIGGMRLSPFPFQEGQPRWEVLIFWGAAFLMWRLHILGGGDAKLLMVEGALFPTYPFVLLTGVCWLLVAGGVVLSRSYREGKWAGVAALGQRLGWKFLALRFVPSEEEFRSQAEPATYLFCCSPILYAWLLW